MNTALRLLPDDLCFTLEYDEKKKLCCAILYDNKTDQFSDGNYFNNSISKEFQLARAILIAILKYHNSP